MREPERSASAAQATCAVREPKRSASAAQAPETEREGNGSISADRDHPLAARGVSRPNGREEPLAAGAVAVARNATAKATVAVAWFLAGAIALADMVGYAKIVDLREQNATVVAEHHHDWSRATEAPRLKMITGTKNPFTAENTYSYLRLVDKASGRELFRAPVPALTLLWISPDSRYVVGLSDVKLWNPYQLVVFTRGGRRVFERDFTNDTSPGIVQSVTNLISWYKEPTPIIRIDETPVWVNLWIEDRLGTPRRFRFRDGEQEKK